ncbi:unnamed protein product [Prorocentrum cordatum]|uniref:Uncharacterized protein n=1 Tax=Prorocentrum cordatum TaxID=2364126 RepID=A0ABN9VL47_9DINO|nr:unnamed protein product [Polarella glacialis]
MNASAPDPAVTIEVEVKGMVHYSLVQTMREYMEIYKSMGFTEQDLEEVGEFLFRYPLHIMVFMQVIGFLQMSLTTLAFKNDVSFFKGRSDYTGLSSRSLGTDTLQEIIIFFYLLDFDNISRILLFQWGVGALISAWKFARVAQLSVYWAYFLPWVRYGRASAVSSSEKDTEDIDVRGMAYLKMVLYPLSVVWGLYSLYHYSYKSWWSHRGFPPWLTSPTPSDSST